MTGHQTTFTEDPPRPTNGNHADSDTLDNLVLKLDGFEGPIDLLLHLARTQKVDLAQISILQLVRQYLSFIDHTRRINLDLTGEYLVMASWLTYLKSKLLLPQEDAESSEPDSEDVAAALTYQLRRLEAMQQAAEILQNKDRLGRDFFTLGYIDRPKSRQHITYKISLYALLKAYGNMHRRNNPVPYTPKAYNLWSIEKAHESLTAMLGALPKKGAHSVWTTLSSFIQEKSQDPLLARSILATTLSASLELVKQSQAEIQQKELFSPIYIRATYDQPQHMHDIEQRSESSPRQKHNTKPGLDASQNMDKK